MEKELYLRGLQNRRRITKKMCDSQLLSFADICEYFADNSLITKLDLDYYKIDPQDLPIESNQELLETIIKQRNNYFDELQKGNLSQQEFEEKITEFGFFKVPVNKTKHKEEEFIISSNYPGQEYKLIFEQGYSTGQLCKEFGYTNSELWSKLKQQGISTQQEYKKLRAHGVFMKNEPIRKDFANGMTITDLCDKYNLSAPTLRIILKEQREDKKSSYDDVINLYLRDLSIPEIQDIYHVSISKINDLIKNIRKENDKFVRNNESRQKQCFEWFFNENKSKREIADHFQISLRTVETDIIAYGNKYPDLVPDYYKEKIAHLKELRAKRPELIEQLQELRGKNYTNDEAKDVVHYSYHAVKYHFLKSNDLSASPKWQNKQWNTYIRRKNTIPRLLEGNNMKQIAHMYNLPIEEVKRDAEYLEKIKNGHFDKKIAIADRREEVMNYRSLGYSLEEISKMLNVSKSTIQQDEIIMKNEAKPQIYANAIQEFKNLIKTQSQIEQADKEIEEIEL